MKHTRVIGASTVLAVLVAAGCGKKTDEAKSSEPAKAVEATAPAPAPAPAPAAAPKPASKPADDELLAYELGKEMAWVEVYALMNKPAQGDDDYAKAQAVAAMLGISPPERAKVGAHPEDAVANELFTKKSKSAGGYFGLGMSLIRAEFGAMLGGVDISEHLKTIELVAGKLQIPDALWKDQLARVKQQPSGDAASKTLDEIYKGVLSYLKDRARAG